MKNNCGITKIDFVDAGFKAVLQSEGCQEVVGTAAQAMADKANANYGGDGYEASTVYGGRAQRYIGLVKATDKESLKAESEDQALTRAII